MNPDIVVVVAYGKLISKKFLDIPTKGFINIHASLLPKWRGAAPIQRAIINLDKQTGISIMKIKEELDSGPVMRKIKIDINSSDTSDIISEKLSKISSEHIVGALGDIFNEKKNYLSKIISSIIILISCFLSLIETGSQITVTLILMLIIMNYWFINGKIFFVGILLVFLKIF